MPGATPTEVTSPWAYAPSGSAGPAAAAARAAAARGGAGGCPPSGAPSNAVSAGADDALSWRAKVTSQAVLRGTCQKTCEAGEAVVRAE
jgi:hypothetical protein